MIASGVRIEERTQIAMFFWILAQLQKQSHNCFWSLLAYVLYHHQHHHHFDNKTFKQKELEHYV